MNTKLSTPLSAPHTKKMHEALPESESYLSVHHVSLSIQDKHILRDISFTMPKTGITTLIGPSGAGKSSLLRCMNLLNSDWSGSIEVHGQSVKSWSNGEDHLRKFIGFIAQKPGIFPTSIFKNVAFGLNKTEHKHDLHDWVQLCLQQAALWDEVKDRVHQSALTLSIGQQQRLCLARALALKPSVLLLDEPTASLDPRSKQLIESSLSALAKQMPVLCVTHDLEQAKRLNGQVVFMCVGKIIEIGDCVSILNSPQKIETREFLRWDVCDCD
ncbi:MAG: ATP-binding cassette domain-containing protein [Ghiorsea sp.]